MLRVAAWTYLPRYSGWAQDDYWLIPRNCVTPRLSNGFAIHRAVLLLQTHSPPKPLRRAPGAGTTVALLLPGLLMIFVALLTVIRLHYVLLTAPIANRWNSRGQRRRVHAVVGKPPEETNDVPALEKRSETQPAVHTVGVPHYAVPPNGHGKHEEPPWTQPALRLLHRCQVSIRVQRIPVPWSG